MCVEAQSGSVDLLRTVSSGVEALKYNYAAAGPVCELKAGLDVFTSNHMGWSLLLCRYR